MKKRSIITGNINIDGFKVIMNTGNSHVNKVFKTVLNQYLIELWIYFKFMLLCHVKRTPYYSVKPKGTLC